MSWLPPPEEQTMPRDALPLWAPRRADDLPVEIAAAEFAYAAIDELEEGRVRLAVSEWPRIDEAGRVRFVGRRLTLSFELGTLQDFVDASRVPAELRGRPLRIGDVFALRLRVGFPDRRAGADVDWGDPAAWVEPPVVDITREARDITKASFYAAVAPLLDPAEAAQIVAESEPEPPPAAAF